MIDSTLPSATLPMADQPAKPQYIHEQHNENCQQFFGPVTGCVFAMPGAHVTQNASPSKPKARAKAKANARSTSPLSEGKNTSASAPLLDTFCKKKGLTDQHFALLHSTLQQEGWVTDNSSVDAFVDLFSGRQCDCHIVWNPLTGKGILRDLFKMMLDGGFIKCPDGLQYIQILESHFIYPDGNPVRGLKGGYASKKARSVIDDCRKVLLINPRAHDFSSISEEIDDEFSDIRYDPFES